MASSSTNGKGRLLAISEVLLHPDPYPSREAWHDGIRFDEVSLGYPEEAQERPDRPRRLTQILPGQVLR